jgi:hypothetical protein
VNFAFSSVGRGTSRLLAFMAEGRSNVLRPPGFEGGHDGSAYLAGMQARIREENTQRRQLTWAAQAGRRWVGEFRAQQFRTAPPGVASLTLCDTYPGAQARGRQPLPVGHGTRLGHVLSRGLHSGECFALGVCRVNA